MIGITHRKDKKEFLIKILEKLNIEENERQLYILSLEVLDEKEFNLFFDKIVEQVHENGEEKEEIEGKKLAPFSANIL